MKTNSDVQFTTVDLVVRDLVCHPVGDESTLMDYLSPRMLRMMGVPATGIAKVSFTCTMSLLFMGGSEYDIDVNIDKVTICIREGS